ncbi:hypothetical protein KI387_002372, partial [Taxus chinensis]
EKRQRNNGFLFSTLVLRRVKGKETELEKAWRKNVELEECLKQLSMESHIWKNVAKNNESIANTLKQNLEQVLAQTREHIREGRNDNKEEDTLSC